MDNFHGMRKVVAHLQADVLSLDFLEKHVREVIEAHLRSKLGALS